MLFNSSIFNFLTKNGKVSLPGEAKLMKAFKITAFLVYKNLGLSNLGYERNEIDYEMDSHLLAQVSSCEFCEISKNTFFTEHLWTTASIFMSFTNSRIYWRVYVMVASVNDRKTEKMILADIYLLKINNINTRNMFKVIKKTERRQWSCAGNSFVNFEHILRLFLVFLLLLWTSNLLLVFWCFQEDKKGIVEIKGLAYSRIPWRFRKFTLNNFFIKHFQLFLANSFFIVS